MYKNEKFNDRLCVSYTYVDMYTFYIHTYVYLYCLQYVHECIKKDVKRMLYKHENILLYEQVH